MRARRVGRPGRSLGVVFGARNDVGAVSGTGRRIPRQCIPYATVAQYFHTYPHGGLLKKEECILFSGGARGAEAAFGAHAERLGIEEVNFTFEGRNIVRERGVAC